MNLALFHDWDLSKLIQNCRRKLEWLSQNVNVTFWRWSLHHFNASIFFLFLSRADASIYLHCYASKVGPSSEELNVREKFGQLKIREIYLYIFFLFVSTTQTRSIGFYSYSNLIGTLNCCCALIFEKETNFRLIFMLFFL